MSKIVLNNIEYSVDEKNITGNIKKILLKDINFWLNTDSITGLTGPSGCGKTTLGKLIAGIIKPASGTISLENITVNDIQMLNQNNQYILNPSRKVISLLEDPLLSLNKEERKESIESVIVLCGLDGLTEKRAGILSGGERQRTAFARLLLTDAKYFVLDEPFSAQDESANEIMINVINERNKAGKGFLIISHDKEYLNEYCNDKFVMDRGKIKKF